MTTQRIDIALARRLAPRAPRATWPALRDWVDVSTASDLDATQLDLLTDWVSRERDAVGRAA